MLKSHYVLAERNVSSEMLGSTLLSLGCCYKMWRERTRSYSLLHSKKGHGQPCFPPAIQTLRDQ